MEEGREDLESPAQVGGEVAGAGRGPLRMETKNLR